MAKTRPPGMSSALCPMCPASLPNHGAVSATIRGPTPMAKPDSRIEKCQTIVKNKMLPRNIALKPIANTKAAPFAHRKFRTRNNESSRRGFDTTRHRWMNTARRPAATSTHAANSALVHPQSAVFTIA